MPDKKVLAKELKITSVYWILYSYKLSDEILLHVHVHVHVYAI